jgi:hypothetical protein
MKRKNFNEYYQASSHILLVLFINIMKICVKRSIFILFYFDILSIILNRQKYRLSKYSYI